MLDHTLPARKATLSLVVDINEVRDQGEIHINLAATPNECDALAKQLKILEINNIKSSILLQKGPRPDLFEIEGHISANVVQECSVTLAPVQEAIEEHFSEILTTSPETLRAAEEDEDADKPIELIEHGKINVGTIVSQWLALSLNPFPRSSDAPVFAHIEADDAGRADTHRPFEILDKIKDK